MAVHLGYVATLTVVALIAGLTFAAEARAADGPLIVAHRGASADAPENTLSAFREAWRQDADAIEGDFYLTRDGRIVCFHDKTAKRTTDGKSTIKVADATLAELKKLDVGSWFDPKFAGERVPTLEEVLATVPAGKLMLIEIKCGVEIVPVLTRALAETTLKREQLRVIAFDAEVIAACKKAMPDVQAYWLTAFKRHKVTGAWTPSFASVLETLKRIGADGVDCEAAVCVDVSFAKMLRDAGMQFHCWTINDAERARRFAKLGVDSITTDQPAKLRAALEDRP